MALHPAGYNSQRDIATRLKAQETALDMLEAEVDALGPPVTEGDGIDIVGNEIRLDIDSLPPAP